MLVDFSITNFGPIKDTVTLSFEPVDDSSYSAEFLIETPIEGLKLLKLGLIYGANASGKSTVLEALDFLRSLVLNPLERKNEELPYNPFLFVPDDTLDKSELDIHFITTKGKRYHYHVAFTRKCILEEVLYVRDPGERIVYHRTTDEDQMTVHIVAGNFYKSYRTDFRALETSTLWNNTVLGGSLKVSVSIPAISDVVRWFDDYLYPLVSPSTNLFGYVSHLIEDKKIRKENIMKLLRRADFMIDSVNIEHVSLDKESMEKFVNILHHQRPNLSDEEIRKKAEPRYVTFTHHYKGGQAVLNYGMESLGTQRFYQFCGILDLLLRKPCMFFIDEIETSLHPDLLEYFIFVFLLNSKHSQMLATTHYREFLINKEHVRPDTIWFTSKDVEGKVDLYSLADFEKGLFKDVKNPYYNLYKIGKLGAVPHLGDYYFDLGDEETTKE